MSERPERLELLQAIKSTVLDAIDSHGPVNVGVVAARMAVRYPHCGMTLDEIEDELIRQVGMFRGAAEFGHRLP